MRNDAANTLQGLAGNDVLNGYGGNDRLIGWTGQDELTGGNGNDVFVFRKGDTGTSAKTADTITDFWKGDLIEFDAGAGVNFEFIGGRAFGGTPGDIRFRQSDGSTLIEGDLNGDGQADFVVKLNGLQSLTAEDFLL